MSDKIKLDYEDKNDPNILKTLDKYGIVIIRDFLRARDFNELERKTNIFIKQSIDNKDIKPNPKASFYNLRQKKNTTINKRFKSRDGDDGMIDVFHIEKSLADKEKETLNNIKDFAQSICQKAFNIKYKYFSTNLYYNNSISQTRGIHADAKGFPSRIKSFLYMTDIKSVDDGPFSYILGTHRDGGKKYHRKYKIFEPLDGDEDKYIIFKDLRKNDLIIASIAGAHRGMPQKPNHKRITYVHSFDPN